jgi:hypothetical protein
MARINKTGAGGPTPIPEPDSTESIQDANKSKETGAIAPEAEAASAREVVSDPFAAGDLKTSGERIKSLLNSRLQAQTEVKEGADINQEQELADLAANTQRRFAPPYVSVQPVVLSDNISAAEATGETAEMSLTPDQFQINEQGNLVITNEKLIEYFKSLKEAGEDVRLGITKLKRPGEE